MMNVRNHIAAALFSLAALTLFSSCQTRWTSLEQGFQAPPDSVRAAVYWYWLDNKISKEGVVKDLEAMKRVGITRAFIGNQSTDGWDEGLVPLFSDEWWDITHTAIKKAGELGIEIGMFNCPGWSQSGGPWVTPEQSMKYVAGHYQEVEGNGTEQLLELPDVAADRIIAVQAWRKTPGESRSWTLKTRGGVPAVLKMTVPFTVRSLILESENAQWTPVTLSQDGRELAAFTYDRHNMGLNVGFKPLAPWVEGLKETPAGTYELRLEDPSDGTFTVTL
ncbi:MAG: glycoside hydrolase family 2, partial [Bacteroidales bacterium]|nr:glycoside hydrolase family 2 [Bacteroidales bacterium]